MKNSNILIVFQRCSTSMARLNKHLHSTLQIQAS